MKRPIFKAAAITRLDRVIRGNGRWRLHRWIARSSRALTGGVLHSGHALTVKCVSTAFLMSLASATLLPALALADVVVAKRPVRAGMLLGYEDVRLMARPAPAGAVTDIKEVIGKETRISLYAGRAIFSANVGPPTIVGRNAIVTVRFNRGGLSLRAEGRALDAGGMGERIRVMNLESKLTVTGTVTGPSLIEVN